LELKDLITSCKKNDRRAQHELFLRYRVSLFNISLKYCRNNKEAEDNLHDAFIIIFQSIKKYNDKGSFEGWMKRITINKAIDKFKKNIKSSKELPLNLKDDNIYLEDELKISLDTLLKLIQELPDQYRLVFNLFQLDNYSHKEVAQLLSISENTSKSNYHRAKIILREKISTLNNPNLKKKIS